MKYVNYDNLETAKEMIKVALDKKVDKEDGKGLSTNDYTNEEKLKLAGVEEEANKTIVDSELNLESTNPVENKVISEELNTKANKVEVEEALNTKADKIAVEEALETKADKQEVAEALGTKVDKETGKGLSTNDFTDKEKEKLSKLDINSNENVIEVIKQNGEVLEIHDKSVNIVTITEDTIDNKIKNAVKNVEVELTDYAKRSDIPKNVSDLFNDKAFISSSDEKDPTVPAHVKAITEAQITKWDSGTGSGSGTPEVVISGTTPTTGEPIWIQTSQNLFVPKITKNGYLIKSDGSLGYKADDRYWINDYLEIEPNTTYTFAEKCYNSLGHHAWYDADKNFISAFLQVNLLETTATSPANAKYIRLSLFSGDSNYGDDLDTFQFVKGTTLPPYSPATEGTKVHVKNGGGVYEEIYDSESPAEQYTLPAATATTLGGIKVGNNLTIDADGTLHAQAGGSGDITAVSESTEFLQIVSDKTFTISVGSAWTRHIVPFNKEQVKIGDNLSITSDGGIKIGPGISKIKIDSHLFLKSSTSCTLDARLRLVRDGREYSFVGFYYPITTSYGSFLLTNPIVDVQENDIIYAVVSTGSSNVTFSFATDGYLVVQKINDTTIITGGGITEETDPTVPAHVKAITEEDIEKWNSGAAGCETPSIITICNQSSNLSVTVSSSWTPYEIPLTQLSTNMGDVFTHENGTIKVNRDCTALVSSSTLVKFIEDKIINVLIYVIRNGSRLLISNGYIITANWQTVSISPVVYDFLKGDIIQMYIECGATGTLGVGNGKGAQITVQKINETNVISGGSGGDVSIDGISVKNDIITLKSAADLNISTTGQYEYFTMGVVSQLGDGFTIEDGNVKIGKDVSRVKISFTSSLSGVTTTGTKYLRVESNGEALAMSKKDVNSGELDIITMTPVIVDVKEGDILKLGAYGAVGDWYYQGQTYLTIEKINEVSVIGTEQNNGTYMWIHNSAPFTLEPETITKIPFDKLLDDTSSGKLIHEDGGIRIGKGVKQILVISKWNSWTYDCQKYIYVYKNGAGYESAGFQNGAWTANVVSYINVTEGDFIEIYGYHNHSSSMKIASNDQQSGLKVVVLGETTNIEINGDVTGGSTEEDTGWVDATLTEDFKLYNDASKCHYRRKGNLVSIQFVLSPAKADNVLNSATETTAFNLPEKFRPPISLNTVCQGSGTNIFLVGVNTSGNVNIYRYRNSASYSSSPPATSAWLPFHITYFTD